MSTRGYNSMGPIYAQPRIFQKGFGFTGYGASPPMVVGFGVGSILRNSFFHFLPYLKNASRSIGKEILRVGSSLLENKDEEGNFRDKLKKETKKSIKNLSSKALEKLSKFEGEGKKIKHRKKKVTVNRKLTFDCNSRKKKKPVRRRKKSESGFNKLF